MPDKPGISASGIWESIGAPSKPPEPDGKKEPTPVILVGLADLLADERVNEILRLIKPKVVTGQFSTVFANQTVAFSGTDKDLDVTDYNAVHVDVVVGGSTPSAVLTLYSIPYKGYQGPLVALPGSDASQTITVSKSFDIACGSTFLRVALSSVTSGNFTVTLTPFNAGKANGVEINSVSAAKLTKGGTTAELATCTNANTDYAASGAMPSGTKYVAIYCASAVVVAMGEATSSTVGVGIGAGQSVTLPATVTGTAANDTVHVQSPVAGAVVRLTYMKD